MTPGDQPEAPQRVSQRASSDVIPGKFITFEGGEGSGKSTQSKRLFEALKGILNPIGINIIWTREPGGSIGAEEIRDLLVKGDGQRWAATTESLLMFAARDDHWKRHIAPALAAGTWVICDRFADSSFVYQGYVKGVPMDFLKTLYTHTVGDRLPDRTYLLDVPVEIGLDRASARTKETASAENRFEGLGLEFHTRVRQGFQNLAAAEPNRFCVIDGTQALDVIEAQIISDAKQCLINVADPLNPADRLNSTDRTGEL